MTGRRGTPPRDEEFLKKLTALAENSLLIYKIPDPAVRIKGLYQHPLQKIVRNQGNYQKKKFHCWRWLDFLYVVRLVVPNPEALKTRIPPQGEQGESNQSRADAHDDGKGGGDAGDLRPASSGSNSSA